MDKIFFKHKVGPRKYKHMVKETIETFDVDYFCGNFNNVLMKLNDLKKKYLYVDNQYDGLELIDDIGSYNDWTTIVLLGIREENEKEKNARLKKETKEKELKKLGDVEAKEERQKQYIKLKKEFGE